MFACIHGRSISKSRPEAEAPDRLLVDLAFTFSPLIEQTSADTVVADISGQDLLFGHSVLSSAERVGNGELNAAGNIASELIQQAEKLNLEINVAVAANPDAAIHAARAFKGKTIVQLGDELVSLGMLSIKHLDFSLAGIDAHLAEDMQETFALWGIRTFGDLAKLPLAGVAERLGQEGVRLQKLAQGKTDRRLNLVRPPIGFSQSIELEHPVEALEPLAFILSRLLNKLCANLMEYALATNELRLRLVTEPRAVATGSNTYGDSSEVSSLHERTITLPVPMQNPKTLLRLLLFDIELEPPRAPIVALTISAEPVKPRASQTGLFVPLAPEPEKLEITLARLAKLVGPDNVGSPELLDTHRPDTFRMKRFRLPHPASRKRARSNPKPAIRNPQCILGFRVFRPPWRADVQTIQGQPARISAHSTNSSGRVRGKVGCASGPWRASGDWWRHDVWARDEWDVAVIDSINQQGEVLCRIYRDLTSDEWFVAGIYD